VYASLGSAGPSPATGRLPSRVAEAVRLPAPPRQLVWADDERVVVAVVDHALHLFPTRDPAAGAAAAVVVPVFAPGTAVGVVEVGPDGRQLWATAADDATRVCRVDMGAQPPVPVTPSTAAARDEDLARRAVPRVVAADADGELLLLQVRACA
jgi:hypothetical protein